MVILKDSGALNLPHSTQRLELCSLKFWEERYRQYDEKRVSPFLYLGEDIGDESPISGQDKIHHWLKH